MIIKIEQVFTRQKYYKKVGSAKSKLPVFYTNKFNMQINQTIAVLKLYLKYFELNLIRTIV